MVLNPLCRISFKEAWNRIVQDSGGVLNTSPFAYSFFALGEKRNGMKNFPPNGIKQFGFPSALRTQNVHRST